MKTKIFFSFFLFLLLLLLFFFPEKKVPFFFDTIQREINSLKQLQNSWVVPALVYWHSGCHINYKPNWIKNNFGD